MTALLYHWLRYALNLYPPVLSGYINLLPLAVHCLALPTKLHRLPTFYLSTADDRTKQITEYVKHAHNDRNSQRSRNPNPTNTTASAAATITPSGVTWPHPSQKFIVRPLAVCWSIEKWE